MRIQKLGTVLMLLLVSGCAGMGAAPAEKAGEAELSIAALFQTENGDAVRNDASEVALLFVLPEYDTLRCALWLAEAVHMDFSTEGR